MQIRTRLTLQFIFTVAAILLLTLGIIYARYKSTMQDEFYRGLKYKAVMTANLVLRQEEKFTPVDGRTTPATNLLPASEAFAIYNVRQQRLFAFNPAMAAISEQDFDRIRAQGEYRFQYGRLSAIGIRHQSGTGNEYVVVVGSVFEAEELKKLQNILVFSFLFAITIIALGGWFFAGQAMAPVSRIVNEVDNILPSNMSTRLIEPANPDEIGRLIHTFNRLLDRIYFAFQMQKRFISNVSHELKNPISVVISQLEVGLTRERSTEEYKETMESVLDDSRSLAEITEKLLQMAKVYSEDSNIAFEDIRLDEVVLQVRSALLRAQPGYRIFFDITGDIDLETALDVKGNEPLLKLAFTNLIENGCKFSPDKTVHINIITHTEGRPELEITDNGPGIPQQDLPLIFQPFYRGVQQARAPGSGIGLSLVDSILRLHHIKLSIQSEQGKGTTFRLFFE
jgi:signal transduction histidine kinase